MITTKLLTESSLGRLCCSSDREKHLNLAFPVSHDSVVQCLGGHHAWGDAHRHELLKQKLASVRQPHQRDLKHGDNRLFADTTAE